MGIKKVLYWFMLRLITTKEFRSFMNENPNPPRVEISRRGGVRVVKDLKA